MSAKILPEEQVPGSGPIGQGSHVVREGECMSSLAAKKGLFVAQIFEHPANAQLSTVRGDPNILLPGDRVTIPNFELKDVDKPTEQKNKFVLLGEPVFLRILVMDRDKPLGGQPFTLVVGGVTIQDTTQPDGTIETRIPPDATTGKWLPRRRPKCRATCPRRPSRGWLADRRSHRGWPCLLLANGNHGLEPR